MKKLIVLRHAHTERDAVDDWHRSLTDRGREQARSVAPALDTLPAQGLRVCVSTALRAMQTWEEIAPALGPGIDVRPTQDLYTFDGDDVLRMLREIDEDVSSLMIVGHNPAVSSLTRMLSGEELPHDRAITKGGALRTCRGAALGYDGRWGDIGSPDCDLDRYLVPAVD